MKFSRVSNSHYVNNLERVSLLPLKRLLQNPIFNYSETMSWCSSLLETLRLFDGDSEDDVN